jgi:hypothetical protein
MQPKFHPSHPKSFLTVTPQACQSSNSEPGLSSLLATNPGKNHFNTYYPSIGLTNENFVQMYLIYFPSACYRNDTGIYIVSVVVNICGE